MQFNKKIQNINKMKSNIIFNGRAKLLNRFKRLKKAEEFLKTGNILNPVAEFSVSICSTQKFICNSDDGGT